MGTKKIRVAMLPLITEMSVETQFPELNQLLLEGILLSPTCPKNDAKLKNNF